MVFVFPMAVAMMASMAGIAGVTMGGLGYSAARDLQNQVLKPDERIESAVCEIYSVDNSNNIDWWSTCSGTFVSAGGLVMSSLYCFRDDTYQCNFNGTTMPFRDLSAYYVRVHNVNGEVGRHYVMKAHIYAYSGLTDIILFQVEPLTLRDTGEVITLTRQPYAEFADSRNLVRGSKVYSMVFSDLDTLRFYQEFEIADDSMQCLFDCWACDCAQTEQIMVSPQPEWWGSRGGAYFNSNNKIVGSPFGDTWSNSATATSSNVGKNVISHMKRETGNGISPLNYLVPTFGIMAQSVGPRILSELNDNVTALLYLPSKGYLFQFLVGQDWYDFLQSTWCGSLDVNYTVIPSSLQNATLYAAEFGSPPDIFTTPGINDEIAPLYDRKRDFPYLPSYILMDAEVSPGHWVSIGEDAGQVPPAAVTVGAGKWAGDQMKVRLYAINDIDDPSLNWQGIYSVTLQPVDPILDQIYLFTGFGDGTIGRVDKLDKPTKFYNKKNQPTNYKELPTIREAFEYFMGKRYPHIAPAMSRKYQKAHQRAQKKK